MNTNHVNDDIDKTDNSNDCAGRIRDNYHSMTKTQKKIAKFIINNEDFVLASSITVLAKKIGTNPASITRFCQSLRYKGYNELKFYIENDMLLLPEKSESVTKNDSLSVSIKKITKFELEALNDTVSLVDEREIQRAVNAINKAGKVYFYGEGGTGSAAQMGYYLFMQSGVTSNYFQSKIIMLMANAHLQKGDVVIAMSFSGMAESVVEALKDIRENHPFVTIIVITAFPNAAMNKYADIRLHYSCNIYDDLQYLHVARMCEISIIGLLQTGIFNYLAREDNRNMDNLKNAIVSLRSK